MLLKDYSPGDTVRTIFHTTALVLRADIGLSADSLLYWDEQRREVGRLHWGKVALVRRGSRDDVQRAAGLLAQHLAAVAAEPEL